MASVFQARVARIHKFRPKCTSPIRTSRPCFGRKGPQWVKPGKAQNEHMLSALPPIATDARTSSIGSFVPEGDMARSKHGPVGQPQSLDT